MAEKEDLDYRVDIGAQIRTWRRAQRISQAEVCKAIGMDAGTLSRFESGVEPSMKLVNIEKIMRQINCVLVVAPLDQVTVRRK